MPKLNDTQSMLLSAASQRDDLSLDPLPEAPAGRSRHTKAIASLVKAGLAERRGEGAVFATIAGLAAIGLSSEEPESGAIAAAQSAAIRVTKSALVIELLQRANGATLHELITATGWLPHTTRAALTGLRKKGHAIERTKRDEVTCYRIAS